MPRSHSVLPDTDQLRTFVALARLENFSRAGDEIGLSQSGVSRRIRSLEDSLSVRLFERIGRRAVLTSAGRALRERLEILMREAEALPRLLHDLSEGVGGELRIGACITAANAMLPPILGAYRKRYPKVDMALAPGGSIDLLGRLRRGTLDVALVASDVVPGDLTIVGAISDDVVLFGAPDHPLCRPRVTAKHLAEYEFIQRESTSDTRRLVAQWFEKNGVRIRTLMDVW